MSVSGKSVKSFKYKTEKGGVWKCGVMEGFKVWSDMMGG